MTRDIDHMLEVYGRRGWYPAKWAHHPQAVKDAIRAEHYVPQVKGCWRNCQRLFLAERLELVYHEGGVSTVGIPMDHAWLELDNQVLELTLDPGNEVTYLASTTYSVEQVRRAVVRSGCWGPVDNQALWHISPFATMRALEERLEAL